MWLAVQTPVRLCAWIDRAAIALLGRLPFGKTCSALRLVPALDRQHSR